MLKYKYFIVGYRNNEFPHFVGNAYETLKEAKEGLEQYLGAYGGGVYIAKVLEGNE